VCVSASQSHRVTQGLKCYNSSPLCDIPYCQPLGASSTPVSPAQAAQLAGLTARAASSLPPLLPHFTSSAQVGKSTQENLYWDPTS
jgi:hypothetical protein